MQYLITPKGDVVVLKDGSTWSYVAPSSDSNVEKLRSMKQPREVVVMLDGLFERMGVHIIDTNEKFTVIHGGDEISFEQGIDENNIDYSVDLYGFQVDYVIHNFEAGYRDELAKFYLIRQFFISSPAGTKNLLNNPLLSNPLLRWIIHGKNLIHVYLMSPDPSEQQDAVFTLFHMDGHWNIAQGLVGQAKRVFKVSVEDAMELEKNIYSGMKNNTLGNWVRLAKWYINWRNRVEVKSV